MKLGWRIVWFAGCVISGARVLASPIVQVPSLEYSQDGVDFQPFAALSGKAKAGTYYDYRNFSGHPEFGTARELTTSALYWDSRHNLFSLMLIAGTDGKGKGEIKFKLDGLPASTVTSISDDPDEFRYTHGKEQAGARFRFNNGTDGLVLGGLEASTSLAVKVAVTGVKHVSEWRLVSGDPAHGGSFIDLDLSEPLYFRTVDVGAIATGHHHHHSIGQVPPVLPPSSGTGTPSTPPDVPEPGIAMIFTGLGLLTLRRRR